MVKSFFYNLIKGGKKRKNKGWGGIFYLIWYEKYKKIMKDLNV